MPEANNGGGGKDTTAGTPPAAPGTQTPETKANTQPDPNAVKTFSQSEFDQAVSKALATREANIRAELDAEKAKEQGKFKELYEKAEADRKALELDRETTKIFADAGLSSLAGAFGGDISSADGRKAFAKSLKGLVDTEVEKRVAEKLKTTAPAKGAADSPAKSPKDMTTEEYAAWRKTQGIH